MMIFNFTDFCLLLFGKITTYYTFLSFALHNEKKLALSRLNEHLLVKKFFGKKAKESSYQVKKKHS